MFYKKIIRPILFNVEPETAHKVSMKALKIAHRMNLTKFLPNKIENDSIEICGLKFNNRIGLAAGFDKNASYIDELATFGFSHIEIGTVTPKPQDGNDKPRLFRLPKDCAIINRMGFNNLGLEQVKLNLSKRKSDVIVGGNIGKNKCTILERADEDYVVCFEELYNFVDYFTINISSPNTPGLRDLLYEKPLQKLLQSIDSSRKGIEVGKNFSKPIFVKISPDMTTKQVDKLIDQCYRNNINGIIATNTTISRDCVDCNEIGGLSGKPIEEKSNRIIKHIYDSTKGDMPIIGVGGVFNKDDYNRKIDSGASLVQIWTSLIYEGPFVVRNILS
jgi:dihydroorotate dehydrogenase